MLFEQSGDIEQRRCAETNYEQLSDEQRAELDMDPITLAQARLYPAWKYPYTLDATIQYHACPDVQQETRDSTSIQGVLYEVETNFLKCYKSERTLSYWLKMEYKREKMHQAFLESENNPDTVLSKLVVMKENSQCTL